MALPDWRMNDDGEPLSPLEAVLRRLDGTEVVVSVAAADHDIDHLAEKVARALSRPGGPQIAQRAIANR